MIQRTQVLQAIQVLQVIQTSLEMHQVLCVRNESHQGFLGLNYDEMHQVLAIYSPFSFVLVRLRFASSSFPAIVTSC